MNEGAKLSGAPPADETSIGAKRSTALQSAPAGLRLASTSGTRSSLGSGGSGPAASPCPRARGHPSPADATRWVLSLTPPVPAAHHRGRVVSGPSSSASPPWGQRLRRLSDCLGCQAGSHGR